MNPKCPNCGSTNTIKMKNGTWLLPNAPLPHWGCKNCRTVFSTGVIN
jgi:transposase-like protein